MGKDGRGGRCPLIQFIIEVVESSLSEETDFKPRGELVNEIGKLRSENKVLSRRSKSEEDSAGEIRDRAKRYRSQAFVENKFEGQKIQP